MAGSIRNEVITLRVTPEERSLIEAKMAQYGATNMSAYLRKMAIDGYIINIDLPELRSISSLLLRAGNNINQIAKRANSTRRVYDTDLQDIKNNQERLLSEVGTLLASIAKLT